MHVRAPCSDFVPFLLQPLAQLPRIRHDLLLVLDELWRFGLLHGGGDRSDGVIVRTPLEAGEDRLVYFRLEVVHDRFTLGVARTHPFPEEDDPGSGAAEALVRRGGDYVAVFERTRSHSRRHQAGDVGHVRHEVSPDVVAYLPEALVVEGSGVAANAGYYHLGAEEARRLG